jgi:hypothetical protein
MDDVDVGVDAYVDDDHAGGGGANRRRSQRFPSELLLTLRFVFFDLCPAPYRERLGDPFIEGFTPKQRDWRWNRLHLGFNSPDGPGGIVPPFDRAT